MDKSKTYFPDVHAVIIGINRYRDDNIPNLQFARADAKAIYSVFTDPEQWSIPPENVTLLLDDQATLKNIRSAIGEKLRRAAGENDLVCIYFAGHGSLTVAPSGERSGDGTEKYLVPANAAYDDLPNTAISMREIKEYFEWKRAEQVVLLIDSCFNGDEGGRTFMNPHFPKEFDFTDVYLDELVGAGKAVMVACEANEVALEVNDSEHGLFTYFLLEGMKGEPVLDSDGSVSLDDLYEYVYANITHYAEIFDGNMHPVCKGSLREDILLKKPRKKMPGSPEQLQERANKLYALARKAHEKGDTETVYKALLGVLEIFPNHSKAKKIVTLIEERRRIEQKKAVSGGKATQLYEAEKVGKTRLVRESQTSITTERHGQETLPPLAPPVEAVEEKTAESVVEKPEKPQEKEGKPVSRKKMFTLLAAIVLTALFIMIYAPNLNRNESELFYRSLDKTTRPLRSAPAMLSLDQVKEMLLRYDFYERHWNNIASGFSNILEAGSDEKVLMDFSSLLMWQQSGSDNVMKYEATKAYIEQLNRENFAGHNNWRLPTLEEAMSLVRREKENGDLNILRDFNKTQRWIWTTDDESGSRKWVVSFYDGYCYPNDTRYKSFYVRAVR